MPDVSIRYGDQLDVMPFGSPHRGDAAGLKFAIVRVRAKTNNPQLPVAGSISSGRCERAAQTT
jgi:hypothetical protein